MAVIKRVAAASRDETQVLELRPGISAAGYKVSESPCKTSPKRRADKCCQRLDVLVSYKVPDFN